MADVFELSGTYGTSTGGVAVSAVPEVSAPISEKLSLIRKAISRITLSTDVAVAIDLSGLTQINVLIIKTIGGKVMARITSADGSTQAVPVDSFFAIISSSVPITAVDLTRVVGTSTTVEVFLGEKA